MSVLHFIRAFCIFSSIFLFCFQQAEAKYKLKLISFKKCKVPANREFKNPPLTYTLAARKVDRQTTLLQLKFSITAKEGPVYVFLRDRQTTLLQLNFSITAKEGHFGVRGYQVQQSSSKDLILNLQKVPCSNPVTFQLIKTINLKVDRNCFAVPGNYTADNINIEDFSWILTKAMIGPGKYSYDLEIGTDKGVAACISLACDITSVN